MMDAQTQALITAFPLGFTATVTADGLPAVSPKGTFVVVDDTTLGFADIRSPGTMRNLAHQAYCEVNFIDILKRKGVRVKGPTRPVARGAEGFDALLTRWQAIWPDLSPRIRAIVLIEVEGVGRYTTPPYDDGATEQEMIARTQEMRARVIEAEAQVPLAIADAFRSGNLGVMDYYNIRNIQADTRMRESISGEEDDESTEEEGGGGNN